MSGSVYVVVENEGTEVKDKKIPVQVSVRVRGNLCSDKCLFLKDCGDGNPTMPECRRCILFKERLDDPWSKDFVHNEFRRCRECLGLGQ